MKTEYIKTIHFYLYFIYIDIKWTVDLIAERQIDTITPEQEVFQGVQHTDLIVYLKPHMMLCWRLIMIIHNNY